MRKESVIEFCVGLPEAKWRDGRWAAAGQVWSTVSVDWAQQLLLPFWFPPSSETAGHSRCLDQHKHYRVLVLLPEQIPRAAAGWSTLMNLAGTVVCMNFAVWLTVWLNTKILSGTQTRSSSKKMWSNQAPAKGAFKIYMAWVTIEQMS